MQLYALRSAASWGIGDLGDLARLPGGDGRAGFVLLSPAARAGARRPPVQPSPYYASSRRARNPLHIAVEEVPEAAALDPAARAAFARARAPRAGRCRGCR